MQAHEEMTVRPLVLIIDDDELMRSLMSSALTEKGFDSYETASAAEGIDMLPQLKPDLIILDVQMPELDGFEACQLLRAMPQAKNLPIVMITGADDTESIERAYHVGATDFISKPVNWALLGHRIHYILRAAQTRLALAQSEANNHTMLEALPDRLVMVDRDGQVTQILDPTSSSEAERISNASPSLESLLGDVSEAQIGNILAVVFDQQAEQRIEFSKNTHSIKSYYEARIVPQSDSSALIIIRDITEKRESELRIHNLAYYDSLTSLPNRHYFLQIMGDVISKAAETDQFSLLVLGLDQFKRVNDTLGHSAGDEVLQQVAQRLTDVKAKMSTSDAFLDIARLSGDEFAILASQRDSTFIQSLLREIEKSLLANLSGDGYQLVVTPSIGIATLPYDGTDLPELLQHAAQALSVAKNSGGNTHSYYADSDQGSPSEALELEVALREAVAHESLELYFQPKFDLVGGTAIGAEALLRWQHPQRGSISPAVFIPLAEQSGLIIDIDHWVANRVCKYLQEWQQEGLHCLPMSLNTSGRAFCYGQPVTTMQRALAQHRIEPALVEIEITETALMADVDKATNTLTALKSMGISLAIDDFGTGYSSLAYLKRFSLDVLKIDRAFVKDLEDDDNDRALCRAMIVMAHSLDMKVVAEGIETPFQRDFLAQAGCETGQGFLLAKPMPAEQFKSGFLRPVADDRAQLSLAK